MVSACGLDVPSQVAGDTGLFVDSSCVCWLFVFPLLRLVYPCLLPTFKLLVVFLLLSLLSF